MERKSLPQPRPVLLPLSRQKGSRKSISSALLIISTRGNQPMCRRHKMRKNFCLSEDLFFARKLRQRFLKNLQLYTDRSWVSSTGDSRSMAKSQWRQRDVVVTKLEKEYMNFTPKPLIRSAIKRKFMPDPLPSA